MTDLRRRWNDARTACLGCNGFGVVFEYHGPTVHQAAAMIEAGIKGGGASVKRECKECLGSGKLLRASKPEQSARKSME